MFKPVNTFTRLSSLAEQNNARDFAEDLFGMEDTGDAQHFSDENIAELDYTELANNIETNYDSEPKQSAIVYGPPGVGKSQIVKASAIDIAAKKGLVFVEFSKMSEEDIDNVLADVKKFFVFTDLRTAEMEPTDMQGIPDIKSAKTYLKYQMPVWAYVATRPGSNGLLFFDELNQGTPQILMSLFKTFNNDERLVGQYKLGDGWGVFGAGNLGSLYGTEVLPVALTSRADIWAIKPDPRSWVKWANENGVFKPIISFIQSNPSENFYELPQPGQSSGFPSPRSFVNLSAVIKTVITKYKQMIDKGVNPKTNIYKVIEQYSSSKCGVSWGAKFTIYLRSTRKLDFLNINQEDIGNVDQTFTVIQFIAEQINKQFSEPVPPDASDAAKRKIEESKKQFARKYIEIYEFFKKEHQIVLFTKIRDEYMETYYKLYNFIMNLAKAGDPIFAGHLTSLKSNPEINAEFQKMKK